MKRRPKGRAFLAAGVMLGIVLAGAAPLGAQTKKLQVIREQTEIRLDPDERSPLLATLGRGAILTLASPNLARQMWRYVYFVSLATGKTRSGYVAEASVRKLFPELRTINIDAEDEIGNPKDINLEGSYTPVMKWGLLKSRLVAIEGRPLGQERQDDAEIVSYRRDILDKRCLVEYVFIGARLVATRYHLLENYADKNRYLTDYARLKEHLVRSLGEPLRDESVWLDDRYRNDAAQWGTALSLGQLELRATWSRPDVELILTLAGGENRVAFGAQLSAAPALASNLD
jgi:hypothetical protein